MFESKIIFYDSECLLCRRSIYWIFQKDVQKIFLFAPLKGLTAELHNLENEKNHSDTLILIESFNEPEERKSESGRAVLRILWLLGGKWKLFGWMSFFPEALINPPYRIIAKNRWNLFRKIKDYPQEIDSTRFLP